MPLPGPSGGGGNWWAYDEGSSGTSGHPAKGVVQANSKIAAALKVGAQESQVHGPFDTRADAEAWLNGNSGGGGNGGGGNGGGGNGGGGQWWVDWHKDASGKWIGKVENLPPNTAPVTASGPYQTRAEAEAVAKAGKGPTDSQGPGINFNLSNPLSGIESIAGTAEAFYNDLTDVNMWRSIGWLVLGIGLLGAGLYLWLRHEDIIPPISSYLPLPGNGGSGGGAAVGGAAGGPAGGPAGEAAGGAAGVASELPIAEI